jgi:hypothetical protein
VYGTYSDDLTDAFYAWERRGRGWYGADTFVMLEPTFKRFVYPQFNLIPIQARDDGIRPTLLGSFANRWLVTDSGGQALAPVVADKPIEHPLVAAPESEDTVTLDIRVPQSFVSRPDTGKLFLRALRASQAPLSFEMLGHAGEVHIQLNCRESDVSHVRGSLEGYFPDIAVIDAPDRLLQSWRDGSPHVVVDFGLSNEFFLPLATAQSFTTDPFIPLIAALGDAGESETLCFQVLFEKVRNPWREAIREAVSGPDGKGVFDDAPDYLRLAAAKTESPIVAAVVRVGAQAGSRGRAMALARSIEAFVTQFERSPGNHLMPLTNDGYDDELHLLALLLRETHRAGMILSTDELAGLVHMPDMSVRQSALNRVATRTKAAPVCHVVDALHLGSNVHRGERTAVRLPTIDRLSHMHIVGGTGTGKSTFLLNAALQDIQAGHGVVVLDPHGDLIDDLMARIPESRCHDVILFDPSDDTHPIGLNVLSATNEWERHHLVSDVVGMFERLATSWGDSMGSVLSNAVLAVVESKRGGTLLDLRRFLLDPDTRKAYLAEIDDDEIRFFWEKSFVHIGTRSIGPILTRLDSFLRPTIIRRIVGQAQSGFDLGQVLDGKHILLAKLSQGLLGEANASLLGSVLVSQIHLAALARQRLAKSERKPAFIYIDEFQHFVTPSMASLLSEGRKFGVGLVLAHQTLHQIQGSPVESAVMGNTYARMAFRVSENDAAKLATGFSFFEARDLLALDRGQAIIRLGSADRDCNLETSLPVTVDPNVASVRTDLIRESSRSQFGSNQGISHPTSDLETETESEALAVEATERDIENIATPKASDFLPIIMPKGRHASGQEHKYLTHLVARLGQERGFLAVLEEPVGSGRVDVALRRDGIAIACEISVSTEVTHELGNAKKCLDGGFQYVALVSSDDGKRKRLKTAIAKGNNYNAVNVCSPEELAVFLDALAMPPTPDERITLGYKVRVKRQNQSASDMATRRDTVGKIVTRSILEDE